MPMRKLPCAVVCVALYLQAVAFAGEGAPSRPVAGWFEVQLTGSGTISTSI